MDLDLVLDLKTFRLADKGKLQDLKRRRRHKCELEHNDSQFGPPLIVSEIKCRPEYEGDQRLLLTTNWDEVTCKLCLARRPK